MRILVIADHHQGQLNKSLYQSLSATQALNAPTDVLIATQAIDPYREALSTLPVETIYTVQSDIYQTTIAEDLAQQILLIAHQYTHILFSNTALAKSTAPRLAALLDTDQVSEVTKILSEDTFEHPIYVGNVIETVRLHSPIKILTLRVTAFQATQNTGQPQWHSLESIEHFKGTFAENQPPHTEQQAVTLENARIVLCAGRGFKSKEDLNTLHILQNKLNAALGATRAIVDEGLVPNDIQVGQTGKTIAPELYIGFGVSGALQHTAGIKDAQYIVAINKDPQAPIFKIADFYWVGDLFEAINELNNTL